MDLHYRGGSRIPRRGGPSIQICQIFPKKLHEIKKILVRGAPGPLLDPPLLKECTCVDFIQSAKFFSFKCVNSMRNTCMRWIQDSPTEGAICPIFYPETA